LWEGRVVAAKAEKMPRGQDARIMPMIREVMGTEELRNLDRIVAAKGPGSFTGTRIGIAVAQGLGFGLEKPVVGVDRFESYKRLCAGDDVVVVLNSMRKELFCCEYKKGTERKIQMLRKEEIELLIKGRAVTGDVKMDSGNYKEYSPKDILEINAIIAAGADADDDRYKPVPLYVREPDVSAPNKRQT